jgi:hypothetical protein
VSATARWALALLLLALLHPLRVLGARPVSFSLSTDRSFTPTDKPTIHLYAQNVDELEFRIYRVQNPAKFLGGLPDLHSFDNGTPWGPKEQIDERTWLEKFHDWKHHLWFLVRRFFRAQFTGENRDRLLSLPRFLCSTIASWLRDGVSSCRRPIFPIRRNCPLTR